MANEVTTKVFWSGGSQAVRIPRAMRLSTREVTVRRRGRTLVLDPIADGDGWAGFWEGLVPLTRPVRRWATRRAERRKPL